MLFVIMIAVVVVVVVIVHCCCGCVFHIPNASKDSRAAGVYMCSMDLDRKSRVTCAVYELFCLSNHILYNHYQSYVNDFRVNLMTVSRKTSGLGRRLVPIDHMESSASNRNSSRKQAKSKAGLD